MFTAGCFIALATDYTATDYKVSDPVLFSGEYSTSSGYQLFGSISQIGIGTSSVTGYDIASGFLYFPVVTAPVASVTAGAGQVSLSWSAATAASGWSIGGYNVGQSTTAGGPYTYSASLGNVTSSNRTGLTNGTTYYFIVRAEDAFGKSIATSSEVSASPVASASTAAAAASAGGGGILGAITTFFQGIIERVFDEKEPVVSCTTGDLNSDCRVDLVDFSILAFWYQKKNPPENIDLTGDGVVELRDFSVVSFYWTDPEPLQQHIVRGGALSDELYTVLFAAPQDKISLEGIRSLHDVLGVLIGSDAVQSEIVFPDKDPTLQYFVFHKPVEEKLHGRLTAELSSVVSKPFWWVWIIVGFITALGTVLWRYRFRIKSIF